MGYTGGAGDRITRPRTVYHLALALVLMLVAAACGDDADESALVDETAPAEEQPAEWRHLGADLAHSRTATEDQLGPDNIDALAPSWELEDVNGVTGTPIVVDGIVYVGDWTGHLRALDAATGDELWSESIDGSRIQSSAAVDEERVFAGTFDANFAAFDRETGDLLWEEQIDDHPFASVFGSPIYIDGLVLVGIGSYENMVSTGEDATFRGSVLALDAETGDERWRYWTTTGDEDEGPGVGIWSTPAVDTARGHLYIGTGQHHAEPTSERSDAIIALDVESGEELWTYQYTEGDVWTLADGGMDADIGAPPNLFQVEGRDAVGAGDKDGVYKALDRETGDLLWSQDLTEGSLQGGIMASAAVAEGNIFVASNHGGQHAALFALDVDTGDEVWAVELDGGMQGPVTWANGVLYTADNSGTISAFNSQDGDLLWSHPVPGQAAGGIAVVDATVYAGYGWWLAGPPDEPAGGLVAFRLDGDSATAPTDGEAMAADGASLYQQHCATCHGADRSGGSGPELEGVNDRLPDDEIREVVSEGRGEMPGWEDSLSPEELEAVVDYLKEG